MLSKKTEVIEISILDNGNVLVKKRISILDNDTVLATLADRSIVTDIDADENIHPAIKNHVKAITAHFKERGDSKTE
jgi:hypothetical protein